AWFFTPPATTSSRPLSLLAALPFSYGYVLAWRSRQQSHLPPGRVRRGQGPSPGSQPICRADRQCPMPLCGGPFPVPCGPPHAPRSEEHTSELQSRENLVCRRLLEKK